MRLGRNTNAGDETREEWSCCERLVRHVIYIFM